MKSNIALLSFVFYAASAPAQPVTNTFSSGSTGADGPLTYAQNLGTVYFPPTGLTAHANNIYNFTTITIGLGTTVRVSGWLISGPVYWLAQGNVTISGVLDLSGQQGHPPNIPSQRAPSEPGAGGYAGGLAQAATTGQNATPGSGPGGGVAVNSGNLAAGGGGTFTGNNYLQPLVGGSGGGGAGACNSINFCAGGGAGGGAILIASSTQITLNEGGAINAQGGGGNSNFGGGGSGGAVRLVSNTIMLDAYINVSGGAGGGCNSSSIYGCPGGPAGGSGIGRLEAFNLSQNAAAAITGTGFASNPINLALPVGGASTLNVTSVNGTPINANPFSFPDITINTASSVPVVISGVNIPPGTTGNLYIFGETTADQTIPFTLTGTLQATTATVNVSYTSTGNRGFAKVIW